MASIFKLFFLSVLLLDAQVAFSFPCSQILNFKEVKKSLVDLGYSSSQATRMIVGGEEWIALLGKGKSKMPIPKKNSVVRDIGTGFSRVFNMRHMTTKASLKPITVYRGMALGSLDQLKLSSRFFSNRTQAGVGNVVWVSRSIDEANHYATFKFQSRSGLCGVILKLKIPAVLFYEVEKNFEGFIHPAHFSNLSNYLEGIYEIHSEADFKWEPGVVDQGEMVTQYKSYSQIASKLGSER